MNLFLKIFLLCFWLAIALIAAAIMLVSFSTQDEVILHQWKKSVAELTAIQSQTAAHLYETEGQIGLQNFLQKLESSERIVSTGFFVEEKQIAGESLPSTANEFVKKTLESGNFEYDLSKKETLIFDEITLRSGERAVFFVKWQHPQFPQADAAGRFSQITFALLTTGLICYLLARYLSEPISKLYRLLKGNSQDETESENNAPAGRADDFDKMAQRIESLISSQKILNRDISHELRTPLSRLAVALEIGRSKANEEAQPYLTRIEREAEILNQMISRILTLSKLETGLKNFHTAEFDLSKIIIEVASDANFETSNQTKRIEIIENEKMIFKGNETLLQSAIENVVRNAVKHSGENSNIEISLQKFEKKAVIKVRDYGRGVEEDKLKDLFRPFYRADDSRERKSGGVGLGLAITERAVSAHGGKVWAENASDGGLIVTIELPCI